MTHAHSLSPSGVLSGAMMIRSVGGDRLCLALPLGRSLNHWSASRDINVSRSSIQLNSEERRHDSLDVGNKNLDFGNTKEAYKSKTFYELLRHYVVFKALSYQRLVDRNKELMELSKKLLGERLFTWMMKKTIYGQFVADEDLFGIKSKIDQLSQSGVHSILDYAVEADVDSNQEVVMEVRQTYSTHLDTYPQKLITKPQFMPHKVNALKPITQSSARTYLYAGEKICEENMKHFKSCIKMVANTSCSLNHHGGAFAAIKLTGLGRVEFLLRFSEVVANNYNIFKKLSDSDDILSAHITPGSFHKGLASVEVKMSESQSERLFKQLDEERARGKVNLFEFYNRFQPGTELHCLFRNKVTSPLSSVLSPEERLQMNTVINRAEQLADYAQEHGVNLLVDAEQTYFQPAIRHIAVNVLMPKYNLDTPTIYSTIQCYLKDAEQKLKMELALADATGCLYCVKLVRGAYMEQERERASVFSYEDPIWPDKQSTDACYHRLMDLLMQESERRPPTSPIYFMIASHNENSIMKATERMRELGIPRSDGTVVFGQLLGMCDHITFPLGQAGYGAFKYMPYGSVKEVLPYLSRRANENRGIFKGAQRERILISKEISRRLMFWKNQ